LVTASEADNRDLFRGLRGSGSNFGVVASMGFQLHLIGPSVAAGLIYFPLADFPELVDHHRKRISRFPNELTTWFFLRLAPPVSTMPKQCFGARRRHLAGVSRQETVDCRIFGSERAIDRHRVKSKDDVEEVRRLDKNCRRRSISSGPDHAACARAHCANDDQAPTLQA
jgi:hypothetical protein